MEKVDVDINEYGEKIKGIFSHNPNGNGIVISVTSPFIEEIHIECDRDIYQEYYLTYSLLEPQVEHPEVNERLIYYNAKEKCYYRSEWRPNEGYIWVYIDKIYIVNHAKRCEKLHAHFRMYNNIHKGQLCVFKGYAVDPNGQCKRPSTVESMFDRHKWFYDPWSFEVSLLNRDTIDDFVEETPISKEMTDKMVSYHISQRKDKRRAKIRELRRNFLDKLSKFAQFVEKYSTLFVAIISAIVGSLFTFFLGNIMPILKWFSKQFGG